MVSWSGIFLVGISTVWFPLLRMAAYTSSVLLLWDCDIKALLTWLKTDVFYFILFFPFFSVTNDVTDDAVQAVAIACVFVMERVF